MTPVTITRVTTTIRATAIVYQQQHEQQYQQHNDNTITNYNRIKNYIVYNI